jgi:hypothetical protein
LSQKQKASFHPSLQPSTESHFLLFNRLPYELRREIWQLCRPRRVIDFDMVPKGRNDLPIACKGVARTSALNSRLPVITRVCRESRAIAFGRDADLTQPDGLSDLESRSQDWLERKTIPSTDIVHLNVRIKYSFVSY